MAAAKREEESGRAESAEIASENCGTGKSKQCFLAQYNFPGRSTLPPSAASSASFASSVASSAATASTAVPFTGVLCLPVLSSLLTFSSLCSPPTRLRLPCLFYFISFLLPLLPLLSSTPPPLSSPLSPPLPHLLTSCCCSSPLFTSFRPLSVAMLSPSRQLGYICGGHEGEGSDHGCNGRAAAGRRV